MEIQETAKTKTHTFRTDSKTLCQIELNGLLNKILY